MYQLPADGPQIRIRPIRPSDAEQLQRGLRELSPETVYRRFLAPKARFSGAELRYLTEVDGHDHVAFVAELATPPHRFLGVGRWVRLADEPGAAEVAILVVDEWQGRGVGKVLATALADEARAQGVQRFTATMQADNRPAHRLMERLTADLDSRHVGAVDELSAPLAA
jgi:RimJ/RimL family protein N-acetyltransferase